MYNSFMRAGFHNGNISLHDWIRVFCCINKASCFAKYDLHRCFVRRFNFSRADVPEHRRVKLDKGSLAKCMARQSGVKITSHAVISLVLIRDCRAIFNSLFIHRDLNVTIFAIYFHLHICIGEFASRVFCAREFGLRLLADFAVDRQNSRFFTRTFSTRHSYLARGFNKVTIFIIDFFTRDSPVARSFYVVSAGIYHTAADVR